jgi:hypothetical protein
VPTVTTEEEPELILPEKLNEVCAVPFTDHPIVALVSVADP